VSSRPTLGTLSYRNSTTLMVLTNRGARRDAYGTLASANSFLDFPGDSPNLGVLCCRWGLGS
jgi:hypothetical protein